MTTRLFGSRVLRAEDRRLLLGGGQYLDDLGHDAYAAAFVRSPHGHAQVLSIDIGDAFDVDGLIAIYTHEDLPGAVGERLPLLIPHPSIVAGLTGYALAKEVVHHVGEPVVMVVARDRYLAEDICDRITVQYEPLQTVVGIETARDGKYLVHPEAPGNIAAHLIQSVGDADAAIDNSPHTLELDLAIERSASTPLEGRGAYARWNSSEGSLRLYSSTQNSAGVRAAVASKLGLPLNKVHCIAPDVGGGFGVKLVHPSPEELLVSWTAITLDHEVKWTEDRREHFVSSAHERAQVQKVRVGFDDDGRLLGLAVQIWHDNGSYLPYGVIVPIITSTQLLGPYKLGAYSVEFWSLYTNTVIVTPYRGAGRPQGVYLMERTMDAIADHLGKDRVDVRQANFIRPEEMPYDRHMIFQDGRPLIYDSGDFPASMAKLKALVGWEDFEDYREQARSAGRRVGIGIGCYVEGTGVGPYEGGHVQVESSGKVIVSTGLTSQGQGHQTVLAQIVADELGVPFDDVTVTTGDSRRMGYSVGTFGSRTAVMSGNAVAFAAQNVRKKALRIAGDALEIDPGDLEIEDGVVRVKGSPEVSMSLATVSVLSNPLRYAFDDASKAATQFVVADLSKPPVADDDEPGLESRDFYSPKQSTFANGMHAVVVETDPETAEIKILRYCVVHDCGSIINPMIVEGQIHGGVAQGVGGALYERMAYDEFGQLLNASFMDFLMPYATEMPPEIEIDHLETPSPLNPLGIKGAGEAGVIPGSAVFASAIEDAEGFRISSMPISPSDLFHLRQRFAAGEIPPLRRRTAPDVVQFATPKDSPS